MPFIETNGIKMHYEEKGEGDPLILIMGFGAPGACLLYTSPSPRDGLLSRMPSSG